jgi:HPt (histidine-containing phosphotransfer) domain-containing protein
MAETDMIDRGVLERLLESFGGDMEFLAELLQTYFDDSPRQIATMQVAAAAGDAEALRRAAHSLKSNSANFGAMALSAKCKELELLGKAGTLDGAADRIAVVAADYEQVRGVLEAMRTGS